MEKLSTDRDGSCQLPEPVVLTQEEAELVAAGTRLVTGVNGKCCPTCGIGPVFQLT